MSDGNNGRVGIDHSRERDSLALLKPCKEEIQYTDERTGGRELSVQGASTESYDTEGSARQDTHQETEDCSQALEYFGLWDGTDDSQKSHSHGGADGPNASQSAAVMTTLNSSIADRSSHRTPSASLADGESSGGPLVAVHDEELQSPAYRPLDLLCWHAVNGIGCKKSRGSSTQARRLYK